jgi:hypothetical protein
MKKLTGTNIGILLVAALLIGFGIWSIAFPQPQRLYWGPVPQYGPHDFGGYTVTEFGARGLGIASLIFGAFLASLALKKDEPR